MSRLSCIHPDWSAPENVRALTTTRAGGHSRGPYAGLNLALHVGDDASDVEANRALLCREARLPDAPLWLQQVHGTRLIDADAAPADVRADGSYSHARGRVCCILTADCVPVLLCDRAGSRVAALHAGWRGLAAGILGRGVARLGCPPGELLAWLGPAIGAAAYEVDEPVFTACARALPQAADAFVATRAGHWQADLHALARRALQAAGVTTIHAAPCCTYSDPARLFSHRRESPCGRMASLIWLA